MSADSNQMLGRSDFADDRCIICCKSATKTNKLQILKQGLNTVLEYTKLVNDIQLHDQIESLQSECLPIRIHRNCQKDIFNKKRKSADKEQSTSSKVQCRETRSQCSMFEWKINCLFCEEPCVEDKKHPERNRINRVEIRTLEMKEHLLQICEKRNYDAWALQVQKHLLECHDLVAAESCYHKQCYNNFRKIETDDVSIKSPGRPVDTIKIDNFERLCEWLELEAELYSLQELRDKLREISETDDVYDIKWIKKKLQERYGDHIFFSTIAGVPNVVCLENLASYILNDKWYTERKESVENEMERIIKTAAKLILNDIRNRKYDNSFYPSEEMIESVAEGRKWLPKCLLLFLGNLLNDPLRQVAIGQCIVKAARPRSCVPPVLFGLGVEMDNVFGSKFLINQLCKLGFSVSPGEVLRYKQSVTENEDVGYFISNNLPGSFTQWMADNADHNSMTIDGKGSMHAMGSICSTTYKGEYSPQRNLKPIPRQNRKTVGEVTKSKGIPIIEYIPSMNSGLSKIDLKNLLKLQIPHVLPCDVNLDMLWHLSYFTNSLRPNWSGFMTDVSVGDYPGKSTISFLPILDLDPNDFTCIYSVLLFICKQAEYLNIETPVITFDQPLWLKALEIVNAKLLIIVLILGGFHLMMSFLGSIGYVMKGSGLNDALQTVYGANTVLHMISGKAVSRALRGHFLTESALTNKLLRDFLLEHRDQTEVENLDDTEHNVLEITVTDAEELVDDVIESEVTEDDTSGESILLEAIGTEMEEKEMNVEFVTDMHEWMNGLESNITKIDVEELKSLVTSIMEDENSAYSMSNSKETKLLMENLNKLKDELSTASRTAKLWIQHLDYIQVLKLFIRAERTGNWSLHLVALSRMINLFAATGHINYAKCARLHLQNMLELPTKYPWVYTNFAEHGYHTVRRSDKYWAGLWSDLIIEQCLMRSLKSRGGITRGRGITESVKVLWISSMHRCAAIHDAMGNLTQQRHHSSEQHVELSSSRIKRDNSDLEKLIGWFDAHEPFDPRQPLLQSIASGVTATDGDGVNCDEAEKVGLLIQETLDRVCIEDASIKRKDHVKTLESLCPGIKIGNETVHIDPLILFTRLTALLQREDDVVSKFSYELAPEPTSLFKDGMMRKPTKSTLRKHLLDKITPSVPVSAKVCVVDGGALLHKVTWQQKGAYEDVIDQYVKYVRNHYSQYDTVCIVFDGYSDKWSLKSQEHQRRMKTITANVNITENSNVFSASKAFLCNEHNKGQLINLLSARLRKCGYDTVECTGDADIFIVKKAYEYALKDAVVVSAEDTDILVLLIYHWHQGFSQVYFNTQWKDRKTKTKLLKFWDVTALVTKIPQRENILFAHAWGGCDTTSATWRKGKTRVIQLLKSPEFKRLADTFSELSSDQDTIGSVGCEIFKSIYGGKVKDSLTTLRHAKFMESVTTTLTPLEPALLPPTERAAFFHSLRVNLQVCQWRYLNLECLKPDEWGWYFNNGILLPIKTDIDPAPESLLKYVRCKCQTSSKNTCGTLSCTCKKNGLKCVTSCGDCRGRDCENIFIITSSDPVDNELDDLNI